MTVTVALLADMQDRQQIADALARFCSCVDDYDMAGLSDVFTQDCMTDYGPGRGGPVRGLSAVRARIARGQSEFVRTHHQLGQSTVTLRGDTASAVTYVTATHQHRIGSERSRAHLRYLDELVRTDHGWRITTRVVHANLVDGFEGVPWLWAPRHEPQTGAEASPGSVD